MTFEEITITDPELGRDNSFVYCIFITNPKALVYIGETRSQYGALGRLSGHMQKTNGTFIKRCYEKKQIDLDRCDCLISMIAFNLCDYPEYCGEINTSKRRALEYFVNMCMEEYGVSDDVETPFDVISWTKIASRLSTDTGIQELAEKISKGFYDRIPFSKSV